MKDLYNVPADIFMSASDKAAELGCVITTCVRKSTHADDDFLYVVIAKKTKPLWENREYCVWTYNTKTDSFCDGVYDVSSYKAIQNLAKRLWAPDEEE